jgi:hypothetical protein
MASKEKSTQLTFSIWKDAKRPLELDCCSPHVTLVEMKFVQTLHNLVAMSSISYSWGDTPWPSHNINVVLVLKGYVRATKSHNIIPRCQIFLIKNENAIGSMKNAKRLFDIWCPTVDTSIQSFFSFLWGWGCQISLFPMCSHQVHNGSQHVPHPFPNSSSLYSISFALSCNSPKEEITTYLFWDCPKLDFNFIYFW